MTAWASEMDFGSRLETGVPVVERKHGGLENQIPDLFILDS